MISMFSLFNIIFFYFFICLKYDDIIVDGIQFLNPNDSLSLIQHGCFLDPLTVINHTMKLSHQETETFLINHCHEHEHSIIPINNCVIPNVIHLISYDRSFTFLHYTAIKSMYQHIQPFAIYLHGHQFHEDSIYMKKIIQEFNVILIPYRFVNQIFGKEIKVIEHISDVARIEILLRFGGMYFDLDVMILKSPTLNLYYQDTVMGLEITKKPQINNGIILAKRNSLFMCDYYTSY